MANKLSHIRNSAQYVLRHYFLGHLRLRRGLPNPKTSEREFHFYRLVLEKGFSRSQGMEADFVCDVGCRNWSYVQSIARFFKNAAMLGIEVDGARRYWNLFRRMDAAEAYAQVLRTQGRKARYLNQDFRNCSDLTTGYRRPVFTFFFPFVSERPCLKWGLPLQFADFKELLDSTSHQAKQKTEILSTHQGEWEAEIATEKYRAAGFLKPDRFVLNPGDTAPFWPSTYPTFIFRTSVE